MYVVVFFLPLYAAFLSSLSCGLQASTWVPSTITVPSNPGNIFLI